MRLVILAIVGALGAAATVDAATIAAATCSSADVQAAINAAGAGDTVVIPAGSCTWTSGITIAKGIKVQGGGSGRIIARSTSTLSVGTGTRTISTQSGLNISVGQTLRISQNGARANYMVGTVSSYSGTTLTMNITSLGGSGSYHLWLVSTTPTTVIVNNTNTTLIDVTENTTKHIEISGFKVAAGVGTSYSIDLHSAAGGKAVLIHDLWMESTSTSSALIRTNSNRGVVWNSSFDSSPFSMAPLAIQMKDGPAGSWTSPSTMGVADTTGESNFYMEDNDFHAFLNATDVDDNGRMVFRHNVLNNAGFGTHGADTSSIGQRHFEVVDNTMVFNGYNDGTTFNMNWWLFVRGGTFVMTGNTIDKIVSTDYGNKNDVNMTVMNLQRSAGPNPCWGAGTSGGAQYPAPRQVGMGYVTGTGTDGLGRKNDIFTYVGDSEPVYIWNNTINNGPLKVGTEDYGGTACTNPDSTPNYIVAGRDYFNNGTAKPGYVRYIYPHPLRSGATVPAPPTNLHIIR